MNMDLEGINAYDSFFRVGGDSIRGYTTCRDGTRQRLELFEMSFNILSSPTSVEERGRAPWNTVAFGPKMATFPA